MPPWNASSDAVLRIFPCPPRAITRRPNSRDSRNGLDRLIASTRSHASSECSAAGSR